MSFIIIISITFIRPTVISISMVIMISLWNSADALFLVHHNFRISYIITAMLVTIPWNMSLTWDNFTQNEQTECIIGVDKLWNRSADEESEIKEAGPEN